MRYFTVPAIIIVYILWSYFAVNDIIFCYKRNDPWDTHTRWWFAITFVALASGFFALNVLYW